VNYFSAIFRLYCFIKYEQDFRTDIFKTKALKKRLCGKSEKSHFSSFYLYHLPVIMIFFNMSALYFQHLDFSPFLQRLFALSLGTSLA